MINNFCVLDLIAAEAGGDSKLFKKLAQEGFSQIPTCSLIQIEVCDQNDIKQQIPARRQIILWKNNQ